MRHAASFGRLATKDIVKARGIFVVLWSHGVSWNVLSEELVFVFEALLPFSLLPRLRVRSVTPFIRLRRLVCGEFFSSRHTSAL